MASSGNYKRILGLLEKWPVDKNKAQGRDIRVYLQKYLNTAQEENKIQSNHTYWDKQYLAIQKLVNNIHKNKYKRSASSTVTGLSAEQCTMALSDEFLEELKKKDESFFRRLISLKS